MRATYLSGKRSLHPMAEEARHPSHPPSPDAGVYFSLICATLDRTDELAALIRSLEGQSFGAFELIVVDQNADARVAELLVRLRPSIRIKHLRTARRGACLARNMGAAEASGAWLGFPDDDCTYRADTLERLERVIQARRPLAVAGNVICEDGRPLGHVPAAGCAIHKGNAFFFGTESILFVEKGPFLAHHGFDERFGPAAPYPAAEGAELLHRLLASRLGPCLFEPAIACLHPRKGAPIDEALLARTRAYAVGAGALACRHARLGLFVWMLARALVGSRLFSGPRRRFHAQRARGLFEGFRAYARSTGVGR
jgi:hypothetical protein